MLGQTITDPFCMESDRERTTGLGLLPMHTVMNPQKTTRVVRARTPGDMPATLAKYISAIQKSLCRDFDPFAILEDGSRDGWRGNRIVGTYLHGALEDAEILAEIGHNRSLPTTSGIEALADWFAPFGKRLEELFF